MNSKSTAKSPKFDHVVAPVMSELDLARLGGGEVAYIKTLTSDEALHMFPHDRRLAEGHPALLSARSRRHADRADRYAAGRHRPCP